MKRIFISLVLLILAYLGWACFRPLPHLKPGQLKLTLIPPVSQPALTWPNVGQSALAIEGTNIILTHGNQTPIPTASTAKLITALTVLQKDPLQPNQSGPIIQLGPSDVALYSNYLNSSGSVAPVANGEKISEYQMLQAMLLPSANNIADSLAIWAFGNLSNYKTAAGIYLSSHGLTNTGLGPDASGFNPGTVSTAADLAKIGELAMAQPVLASIASQPTANIPVANTIKNVNFLLGSHNIIGVKTGNNDQDQGVYISASRVTIDDQPVTIITALAGAPTLPSALNGSLPLIDSAQHNFKNLVSLNSHQIVGYFNLPWGGELPVSLATKLSLTGWSGSVINYQTRLTNLEAKTSGQTIGTLTATVSAPNSPQIDQLILAQNETKPTLKWRLTHPLPN